MSRKPRRSPLLAILLCSMVAAAIAWSLGTRFESTRQSEADAKPPAPVDLFDRVREQRLTRTIVARGTVSSERVTQLSAIVPADGSRAIVTAVPLEVGAVVNNGDAVIEVAGRPVVALTGDVPGFRDLRFGDRGRDVRQLHAALDQLGYETASDEGAIGPATLRALAALYRSLGFDPPDGDVVLPMNESLFAGLPATVVSHPALVGGGSEAELLTLAAGDLSVVANVREPDAPVVRTGLTARVVDELGAIIEGEVIGVAKNPVSTEQGLLRAVTIRTTDRLRAEQYADSLQVSIVVPASDAEVLAVAANAVGFASDGSAFVTIARGGELVAIPVRVGATADGLSEVSPIVAGALAAGDRVRVG